MKINLPILSPRLAMTCFARIFCLVFCVAISSTVLAEAVSWDSLSSKQQKVIGKQLDKRQIKWADLPLERQQKIIKGVDRWTSMTSDQKANAQKRFKRWQDLPSDDRDRLRNRYRKFKTLPVEQQAKLQNRYQWFQNLPVEKRTKLKKRWQNMTPAQKERFKQIRMEREKHRPGMGNEHGLKKGPHKGLKNGPRHAPRHSKSGGAQSLHRKQGLPPPPRTGNLPRAMTGGATSPPPGPLPSGFGNLQPPPPPPQILGGDQDELLPPPPQPLSPPPRRH